MKLDIYTYQSALTYLIDSYNLMKQNSETSLREWIKSMGFNSPSLMMDLLKKKRPLKLKYADQLAQGQKLDDNEKIYFKTLIQFEKATSEDKSYYEEVLTSLRSEESFNKDDGIYSHWLNVIIYTLSQIDDFSLSASEIQSSLTQKMPLAFIEDSLTLLIDQKLIERTSDGQYKRTQEDFITTPNDVSLKTTHNYYKQVISSAQSAVDMNVEDREFQCFAIGMKKENLLKVKEIIRTARKEIASYWDDQGDHVYQFNFNGFPMAKIPQKQYIDVGE